MISKQSQFLRVKHTYTATILLLLLICFPTHVRAIMIEGGIKGIITDVSVIGNRSETPFFDLAVEGQMITADFWYEFDENNFSPSASSDTYREYDFALSDMGMTFHIGAKTLSMPNVNDNFPLVSYRNLIGIFFTSYGDRFELLTATRYSTDFFNNADTSAQINFNHENMSYFEDLNLIQNLSLKSQDNSLLGRFEIWDYGTVNGRSYDIQVTGEFYEFTIGARPANVNEPSSKELLLIALLPLCWRYRSPKKDIS